MKSAKTTRTRAARKPATGDVARLLHELQVHQIELQVQNEELQTARAELETAVARYSELFDFAPMGYATVTSDGKIRAINLAGARLLGQERSRLVGQRFAGALAPDFGESFDRLVVAALTRATLQSCEVELWEAPVFLRCWGTALPAPDRLVLVAFQDVTQEKQHQEELRVAHESLRDASRRKDEFLAILSHELRNPLAPIRNCMFLLSRAEAGSDLAKKAQSILERQVNHLTRLVDDLLDVTRITRGKITLQRQHLDLGDLVRKTLEDHRTTFDESGVALVGEIDAGDIPLHGDPARLVQVLSNLLGNAQKFTPRGGSVTVSLRRVEGWAVLSVSDNGAGIAGDVLEHLFEPFVQGPQSLDRARGGLGLGLATVKGLVELHGGSVAITSPGPGLGSAVTLTLPIEAAAASPLPEAAGKRRLLVIGEGVPDDQALQVALERAGYEVSIARDGLTGLEAAHRVRPDVIVCEINLRGVDGYQVARAVRADRELGGAYLVAVSGDLPGADLDRAKAAGFDRQVATTPTVAELGRWLPEGPAAPAAPATPDA